MASAIKIQDGGLSEKWKLTAGKKKASYTLIPMCSSGSGCRLKSKAPMCSRNMPSPRLVVTGRKKSNSQSPAPGMGGCQKNGCGTESNAPHKKVNVVECSVAI